MVKDLLASLDQPVMNRAHVALSHRDKVPKAANYRYGFCISSTAVAGATMEV